MSISINMTRLPGILATVILVAALQAPTAAAQDLDAERDVVTLESYPNPFNPSTTVRFDVASPGEVRVTVYNLLGTRVRRLVDGPVDAGLHEVRFDASDLPSGIYLVRLDYRGGAVTRAIQLMK